MVYDCFIFFNELDLLELRLFELNDVVDKFVLVESNKTFQNKSKPYYFEENKERFSKYLDKIIHIKISKTPNFIPIINPFSPWKLEENQRNSVLLGLKNCNENDIVLISDVDEIPNAKVLKDCLERGVDKIYGLKMHMFMYYFNNKLVYDKLSGMSQDESKTGIWHCAALLPYHLLKGKKPNKIRRTIMRTKRRGEVYKIIPNSGWHFTYMGGVQAIIDKIESFSHSELNNEKYKDRDRIEELIKSGQDILGREMKFEMISNMEELPNYFQDVETLKKFDKYFLTTK